MPRLLAGAVDGVVQAGEHLVVGAAFHRAAQVAGHQPGQPRHPGADGVQFLALVGAVGQPIELAHRLAQGAGEPGHLLQPLGRNPPLAAIDDDVHGQQRHGQAVAVEFGQQVGILEAGMGRLHRCLDPGIGIQPRPRQQRQGDQGEGPQQDMAHLDGGGHHRRTIPPGRQASRRLIICEPPARELWARRAVRIKPPHGVTRGRENRSRHRAR
ncbi:MAG: hypothetical protein NVV74_14870 [Magnetospirillum sp.]|nr:hypothetical protein [Magnetospirillum sp.]